MAGKVKSADVLIEEILENTDDSNISKIKTIILRLYDCIEDDAITDDILLSLLKKYKQNYSSDFSKLENMCLSSAIEVINNYK